MNLHDQKAGEDMEVDDIYAVDDGRRQHPLRRIYFVFGSFIVMVGDCGALRGGYERVHEAVYTWAEKGLGNLVALALAFCCLSACNILTKAQD